MSVIHLQLHSWATPRFHQKEKDGTSRTRNVELVISYIANASNHHHNDKLICICQQKQKFICRAAFLHAQLIQKCAKMNRRCLPLVNHALKPIQKQHENMMCCIRSLCIVSQSQGSLNSMVLWLMVVSHVQGWSLLEMSVFAQSSVSISVIIQSTLMQHFIYIGQLT